MADAWIKAQAYRLKGFETISRTDDIGALASVNKLFWSHWHRDLGELAMDVLGMGATLDDALLQWMFLFSRADTIYAGSSEIQRNIVGERALGLPSEPKPA